DAVDTSSEELGDIQLEEIGGIDDLVVKCAYQTKTDFVSTVVFVEKLILYAVGGPAGDIQLIDAASEGHAGPGATVIGQRTATILAEVPRRVGKSRRRHQHDGCEKS